MLTLTNPSALLALLGLFVPLAIHLWNRRPGREVAVGSLRWLAAGANRRLRNLRLEQVWRLLLRAALLAALAGALAGPVWRQRRPAGRGQVLVSPALADGGSLAALRPTLDSLRRRGYQLRWLAAGLPLLTAAERRADSLGRAAHFKGRTGFYWERIRQAADSFPGQPLYALTPAALSGFGGPHPALPAHLTWQNVPARAAADWLQAAAGNADSLRLLLGHSDEHQTTFHSVRVARPRPGALLAEAALPPLRYETPAGRPQLVALDSTQAIQPAVPVLAGPLRVLVYAEASRAEEVRYLRAALRAAAVGLPQPLALTVSPTPPDSAQAADWLFWLSERPVPAAWRSRVARGLRLWQEAVGPGVADTATLAIAETAGPAPIRVWRRGAAPLPAGSLLRWADGRGRAVLAGQPAGRGVFYHLATRLSSPWSALAESAELPALLLDVLAPAPSLGTEANLTAHDQRRLDPAQLPARPAPGASPPAAPPVTYRFLDLRPWLVLLVAVLFGLERGLARRRVAPTPSPA